MNTKNILLLLGLILISVNGLIFVKHTDQPDGYTQHDALPGLNCQVNDGCHFDTIVIGGGIAGVTAAVELAKSGQKVAILEVNNYLGGRMKSIPVTLSNGVVAKFDEGASWIHGSGTANPITNLSKKVNGIKIKTTDLQNIQIYDQNGNDVTNQTKNAEQTYSDLIQKAGEWQSIYSMKQAFQGEKPGITKDKYFMYNVAYDLEFQTSGTYGTIGAGGWLDSEFEGTEDLILSGYQSVVQNLAKSSNVSVFLNQKVVAVVSSDNGNVVKCSNGNQATSDNVVIAAPIGVLKTGTISFQPSLPNQKVQAIQSLGLGNVCKIFISFNKNVVLDFPQTDFLGVVANNVNDRGLANFFVNLKHIAGLPALMTFGLGDSSDRVQFMNQAELKNILASRISKFSEQTISPSDFNIYRSSWRNNPNFKGAYTYATTKTKNNHWDDMAKPVKQHNWYFCGEHTISRYRGTVHGAYLSGVNTAKQIINQSN